MNRFDTCVLIFCLLLATVCVEGTLRVNDQFEPIVVNTIPSLQWDYAHFSNTVRYSEWAVSNAYLCPPEDVLALCVADVDRNGQHDIVAFTATGSNWIFLNAHDFTTNAIMWEGPANVSAVDIADLNNDGWLDFVIGRRNDTNLILLGSASLTNYTAIPFGTRPRNTVAVKARDVNRDGYADLLVANAAVDRVFVYFNDGTVTNWTARETLLAASTDTHDIEAADLNHDGMLDVVTVSGNNYGNYVYLNDHTGTNLTPFLILNGYESRGVAIGDLNRDGHNDIVIVNAYGQRDVLLVGNGSGTNYVLQAAVLSGGDESSGVQLGDLNQDGSLDILVNAHLPFPSIVYMNAGSGLVAYTRHTIAWPAAVAASLIRDVNNDGANDLVVLDRGGQAFVLTNTIVNNPLLVRQAAYAVRLYDIGACTPTQVWYSGVVSGAHHGAWNGAVLLSNTARSSEYQVRLTTFGSDGSTNIAHTHFTYRLSNVYCEFSVRLRTVFWAQECGTQACTRFVVRGIAAPSITSIVLTNTTSRRSVLIPPALVWSTNVGPEFLHDMTNDLCLIGRTSGGQIATDSLRVIVTNRGIAIVQPASGTYTNAITNVVVWTVPAIVSHPSWVSYRLNTNAWTPAPSLTSVVVALEAGSNEVQVAYATPQGITETSQIAHIMLETNPPSVVQVYPAEMSVVTTNHVVFGYRVYDGLQGISNEVASGVEAVEFFFWNGAQAFSTNLYGWSSLSNVVNEYVDFPLNPLSDGTNYLWQLRVRDRAGNVATSAITRFIVAATRIHHIYPAHDLWVNTPAVDFLWSVPSFVPSNAQAWFELNANPWIAADSLTGIVHTILPGTNRWRVRVDLPNGQSLTSTMTRVLLDTTPPHAVLLQPQDGFFVKPGMVNFRFLAHDAGGIWRSGIKSIRFHYAGPEGDFWYGLENWVDAPATSVYATLPYNPLTNETGQVYKWRLEVIDRAGNTITTAYSTFGIDATPPTIAVTAPYGGALFTTNSDDFAFLGVANDTHGDLHRILWTNTTTAVSGMATGLASWSAAAAAMKLAEGTNVLVFTAYDTAGYFTSVSASVILDLSPPVITFTHPAGGGLLVTHGEDFTLQGTIVDRFSSVAAASWSNFDVVVEGTLSLVSNAWNIAGHLLKLPYGVTNTILIMAADEYGHATQALVKVLMTAGTNAIPILANWPQQIGMTQTGYIEFVSSPGVLYTLRMGADPGVELAAWHATSDYSLLSFTFAGQNLAPGSEPLVRLISISNGMVAVMPRPFVLVNDWQLDPRGKVPLREQNGDLYCRIIATPPPVIRTEGKSIYISGLAAPAKLLITARGRHTRIPYIEADGVIDSIKSKNCSIDEIHAPEGVRSIAIAGGSLGYQHDKRSRICHGLACHNSAPDNGLRYIKVSPSSGEGGNILGRIAVSNSYRGKGAQLLAPGGTISGIVSLDIIAQLAARTIEDAWIFATGVDDQGYAINTIRGVYLLDSGLSTTGNVMAARQLFVAGMAPDIFWQLVQASNSFAGIVPNGAIRRVSGLPGCVYSEGVYVIGAPVKHVVMPKAIVREKEFWFVNGRLMFVPWDGKSTE